MASSRRSREEKRVLHAIRMARLALPGYARGKPITQREVDRLAAFNNLQVDRAVMEMDSPAVLMPPIAGRHRLILAPHVGMEVAQYITLHEIGHIMTGDADELTILHFTGPLPEAEDVVDAFALCGVMDDLDCQFGEGWAERRIREIVPLDDRGWQVHRIPRLARKVIRMKQLVKEWEG